jgi:hypothetical protein
LTPLIVPIVSVDSVSDLFFTKCFFDFWILKSIDQ